MENNKILMKEKLEFFGILKEALTLPYRCPKFIILTFLTSLPLFCSILIHETLFQHTLIHTAKALQNPPPICHQGVCYYSSQYDNIKSLIGEVSQKFLLLGLFYMGIVHLLDLCNTITIIKSSSAIYGGEESMNVKNMLSRFFKEASFKGPFITSVYVVLLSSLIMLGLVSLATQFYTSESMLFSVVFEMLFLGLFTKYMEWSAIWNMGMVISILEEKHGDVAIGVSAYISKGSRQRGLFLMLVFFVWRVTLRFLCLYVGWNEGGSGIVVTALQVGLACVVNVIKWVAFMIYFYDCKKRFLEKKVDVEDGKQAGAVK